jgi:hypothetical protein
MFSLFKKRSPLPSAEELGRLAASAADETREKWLYFHKTVHLKAEVPLAEKIDFFSQPLSQFFQDKYPQLLLGGSEMFWLTVFTAVLESGTHPKEEANAAIAQLQAKHGRKS